MQVFVRKLEGQIPLGRLRLDGRIILKWILKNRISWCALDSSGSWSEQVVCFCEHGNELTGFIKFIS
jgi:hypothetical protein